MCADFRTSLPGRHERRPLGEHENKQTTRGTLCMPRILRRPKIRMAERGIRASFQASSWYFHAPCLFYPPDTLPVAPQSCQRGYIAAQVSGVVSSSPRTRTSHPDRTAWVPSRSWSMCQRERVRPGPASMTNTVVILPGRDQPILCSMPASQLFAV
jgi:hypothetical protein